MNTQGDAGQRRGIAVLGSTGSVGRQTLEVVAAHADRFRLIALAARRPSDLLRNQIKRFRPEIVVTTATESHPIDLGACAQTGAAGLIEIVTRPDVDIVVVATSGHVAIEATMRAIEHKKTIALANKETLVCAGEIIMPLARDLGVEIRPVDSEHSAIWQALDGAHPAEIERVILTASGGPFRDAPRDVLAKATAEDALQHPTWAMGGKITIDSATMMNKGLEVIEARWLFDLPFDRIEVVIHPESIVHSLVEFVDGGMIAQLGIPDMRLPIQYALSYPERLPLRGPRLSLKDVGTLHFSAPDEQRFPCLRLAREAGVAGQTYPTVLSASDEIAVDAFLAGRLRFLDIPIVVEQVLADHQPAGQTTLDAIAEADAWARRKAHETIAQVQGSR